MLWMIYRDYFKQKINIKDFLSYMNWRSWFIFAILLFGYLFFWYRFIQTQNVWCQAYMYLVGIVLFIYFFTSLRKAVLKNIGGPDDILDHDVITLRNVLKKRGITSASQMDLLIAQINEELPELKRSEKMKRIFFYIVTVIIIPAATSLTNRLVYTNGNGIDIVIAGLTLVLVLTGLIFMVYPILKTAMDLKHDRMKSLKRELEDIKIVDHLS